MRPIFVLLMVSVLSGCSSLEWLSVNTCDYGYRPEDPKIRCGEKWDQLPNQPFEAQARRARGEQW